MKSGIVFLLMLLTSSIIIGQKTLVRSKVLSVEDNLPLVGVSILEKGTSNGTITDLEGSFEMEVRSLQAILVFSYVGYKSVEIPTAEVNGKDIRLEALSEIVEEVVVVGYKSEVRSNVSASISSLKGKDIEKLVVTGIEQALQGQAPGVAVTQVTGAPGDDIAVRIRGVGTLGNNNPLFVIDGVPTTAGLNMFSISDIESIEVLKDAAAASIYGARAANGVLLITTKKGKKGAPVISLETFTGIQEPVRLPKLLNAREYLTIRNEAIGNANQLRNVANQLPVYDTGILDTLPDNDWLDMMFNPAGMHRIALSARGGSESSSYFISGEYLTQEGIFTGQKFDKYQLRLNNDTRKGIFRMGNNLVFAHTDRDVINGSGDGFGPGNELSGIRYALIASPLFPARDRAGNYINVTSLMSDPVLFGDGNANPLVFVENTDWNIKRYRVFGNAYVAVEPLNGLTFRSTLGGDLNFEREKLFKKQLSPAIYAPTSLNEGRVFNNTLIWNNTAEIDRTFGRHKIAAVAGMEAIINHTDYLGASANNFRKTDPLFRYISASIPADIKNIGASGIATEWSLRSYFGQATYAFDGRYVLSASIRRDGSSRFGKNNRWGTFPAFSAAWNVLKEPYLKNPDWISALKIRGSWGMLGNQEIGIYPFSSLVNTGEFVYVFGDKIVTGATVLETGNSNIRWETSTQSNLGLELSLLRDKITFTADLFRKVTDDILVRVPVPQAGGSSRPPFVNAASVENKGVEMNLQTRGRLGQVAWSFGANVTFLKNNVLNIADSEPIPGGFGLSDGPITKTEAGYPVGSFFLYTMEGLFQSEEEISSSPFQSTFTQPGDVRFADINGDNKIDDKDRSHVGSPFPDFTYGLNASLNWKNLDFSILGQGIQGNDVYFLYGNFAYETQLRGFNSYSEILNRWTPENRETEIPRVSVDDRNGNRRISTRFLEDGSYFRLRNISLGYNLAPLLGWQGISQARLYLSVQNALTFTRYPGLDPEIQANTNDSRGLGIPSDLSVGIDWGTVPAPRIWTFGFNTEF
jgi:TonB-linked SusC/RagA family outer membrane protein